MSVESEPYVMEGKRVTVTVVKIDRSCVHYYGADGVVNRSSKVDFDKGLLRAGISPQVIRPGCETEWIETPDWYEENNHG